MRLWLLDKTAHWSELIGDVLSVPFFCLSRWAADEWWRRNAGS